MVCSFRRWYKIEKVIIVTFGEVLEVNAFFVPLHPENLNYPL
jgi:hypothetical protein